MFFLYTTTNTIVAPRHLGTIVQIKSGGYILFPLCMLWSTEDYSQEQGDAVYINTDTVSKTAHPSNLIYDLRVFATSTATY